MKFSKSTKYILAGLVSGTLIIVLTLFFPEHFKFIEFDTTSGFGGFYPVINFWIGLIFLSSLILIARHKFEYLGAAIIGFLFAYNLSLYFSYYSFSLAFAYVSMIIPENLSVTYFSAIFLSSIIPSFFAGALGAFFITSVSGVKNKKAFIYGGLLTIPFSLIVSIWFVSDMFFGSVNYKFNYLEGTIFIYLIHPIWQTGMAWFIYKNSK